jgi:CHAD domain-containing protein
MASALAGVQTVLGELQDAVVAEEWLRTAAAHDPRDAIVAGQLIAAQRAAAASARGDFPAAWKRAAQKDLFSWLT